MRNAGGYAYSFDVGGIRQEADTFTCKHCQQIVHVRPGQRPEDLGGYCGGCGGLICPRCVGKGCDPFEKKLERAEAREAARRSYGF